MEPRTDDTPVLDWHEVARKAFSSAVLAAFVGGAMQVLSEVIRAELEAASKSARGSTPPEERTRHDELTDAAELLGVDLDASQDEIRAALRARLTNSRAHPDHGGDLEEAKRLIAAQNLLIEHARSRSIPTP